MSLDGCCDRLVDGCEASISRHSRSCRRSTISETASEVGQYAEVKNMSAQLSASYTHTRDDQAADRYGLCSRHPHQAIQKHFLISTPRNFLPSKQKAMPGCGRYKKTPHFKSRADNCHIRRFPPGTTAVLMCGSEMRDEWRRRYQSCLLCGPVITTGMVTVYSKR